MIAEVIERRIKRHQNTLNRYYGDGYLGALKSYKEIIEGYAFENRLDTLESVLKLCDDEVIKNNGWVIIHFMAAAGEIIEPLNKIP